jgi:hypothetical protein
MEAIFKFELPLDQYEYDIHVDAIKYYSSHHDIDWSVFRSFIDKGEFYNNELKQVIEKNPKYAKELMVAIRKAIRQIMDNIDIRAGDGRDLYR